MKRKLWLLLTPAVLAALLCGAPASAQDLHRTYALGAGGHIRIQNVSGDLKVVAYPGDTVIVDAIKFGRDKDLLQIEDLSATDKVDLSVRYPQNGNCNASVNFEVRVPAHLDFSFDRLGSVSGSVVIGGVRGDIHASSVSGDILVKEVSGAVSASSVSGNVEAEISRIEGAGEMKFSTVSGSVNVKAPLNGVSDVEMSTLSGSLDTDFPIQMQERRVGPGRSARGRVSDGASTLRISSVSGKISLFKM